jgi:hypothetical protein
MKSPFEAAPGSEELDFRILENANSPTMEQTITEKRNSRRNKSPRRRLNKSIDRSKPISIDDLGEGENCMKVE